MLTDLIRSLFVPPGPGWVFWLALVVAIAVKVWRSASPTTRTVLTVLGMLTLGRLLLPPAVLEGSAPEGFWQNWVTVLTMGVLLAVHSQRQSSGTTLGLFVASGGIALVTGLGGSLTLGLLSAIPAGLAVLTSLHSWLKKQPVVQLPVCVLAAGLVWIVGSSLGNMAFAEVPLRELALALLSFPLASIVPTLLPVRVNERPLLRWLVVFAITAVPALVGFGLTVRHYLNSSSAY